MSWRDSLGEEKIVNSSDDSSMYKRELGRMQYGRINHKLSRTFAWIVCLVFIPRRMVCQQMIYLGG